MLKNYLVVAIRNLFRKRMYAIINVSGLAIGLACCILILRYIQDETNYDTYHDKGERIYRVITEYKQDGEFIGSPIGSYRLGPTLDAQFPQLEHVIRFGDVGGMVEYGEKSFRENQMALVDEQVFDVFSFQLLEGDPATALKDPFTAVVSNTVAEKYFGTENPIGKVLHVNDSYDLKITGVMEEMPRQSHFHFNILISMSTGATIYPDIVLNNWGEGSQYTYFLAKNEEEAKAVEAKFADFIETNMGEGYSDFVRMYLQPLTDIHLHSHLRGELEPNGDIQYVYIFGLIALIILVIACINYMNLATARSSTRMREIGMRKVVGAKRMQLILQFLGESVLVSFLAMALAVILAELFLPIFNNLASKEIEIQYFTDSSFLLTLLGVAIFVGIIAGSYPALYLSRFQPVSILKNQIQHTGGGTIWLRKGLVVFQFTLSIFLIIGTVTIFNQLDFLRNKKLGINRDHVVIMPIQVDSLSRDFPVLKTELERHPNVQSVSASNKRLTRRLSSILGYKIEGVDKENTGIRTVTVDHDFFKTLEVEMVAGRDFSRDFSTDATEAFILNEEAIQSLGLTAETALGNSASTQTLNANNAWEDKKGKIIGVVKDFHFESLGSTITPVVFHVSDVWLHWMTIRIQGQQIPETMAFLQTTNQRFAPDQPFTYSFLEDDIYALYIEEERFLQVFSIFAMIAIFIACLGILGLASYTAEQRTKEIGIRKVLGASVLNIAQLMTKEFLVLIGIAALIGCPLGWYFMSEWLIEFPYHIELSIGIFIQAVLAAFLIALLAVSYQAAKAALSNPVRAIKYE